LPAALCRIVTPKLRGKADGKVFGQRGLASFEGSSQSLRETLSINLAALEKEIEVKIVLHAAIRKTQLNDGLEFLGNHGLRCIGSQLSPNFVVEESGNFHHFGFRGDVVPEADVELNTEFG
jgi:hypothetical protein